MFVNILTVASLLKNAYQWEAVCKFDNKQTNKLPSPQILTRSIKVLATVQKSHHTFTDYWCWVGWEAKGKEILKDGLHLRKVFPHGPLIQQQRVTCGNLYTNSSVPKCWGWGWASPNWITRCNQQGITSLIVPPVVPCWCSVFWDGPGIEDASTISYLCMKSKNSHFVITFLLQLWLCESINHSAFILDNE